MTIYNNGRELLSSLAVSFLQQTNYVTKLPLAYLTADVPRPSHFVLITMVIDVKKNREIGSLHVLIIQEHGVSHHKAAFRDGNRLSSGWTPKYMPTSCSGALRALLDIRRVSIILFQFICVWANIIFVLVIRAT